METTNREPMMSHNAGSERTTEILLYLLHNDSTTAALAERFEVSESNMKKIIAGIRAGGLALTVPDRGNPTVGLTAEARAQVAHLAGSWGITLNEFTGPYSASGARYGVILDPEDRSIRDWTHIGPGVPAEVYHRRAVLISAPASVVPSALQEWFVEHLDEVADIFACYEGETWDGHNHVGSWTSAGWDNEGGGLIEELSARLEREAADLPTVMDAGDWLHGGGTLEWSDDELRAPHADVLVRRYQDVATSDEIVFAGGEDGLRSALQAAVESKLNEVEEDIESCDEDDDELPELRTQAAEMAALLGTF